MSNFWDLIWFFLWSFAFISYLFVLVWILGDLFRDRTVGGWGKAVWMVFLVFVPFLTALVYLIARGGGMAERGAAAAREAKEAQDAYIKKTAGAASTSPSEEIAKAKALLDAGTISQAEYDAIKAKALA